MGENLGQVKGAIALAGGTITALLGGWDSYLKLLLLIMLIDIVTGVLKSIEQKVLSSAVMRKGILNKVVILLLVALGVVIDEAFAGATANGLHIGELTIIIRNCIVIWFCVEEGISVCENCAKLGVPIPGVIKQVLECIESGVSNSTPSAVMNFFKKATGINVSFGEDKPKSDKSKTEDTENAAGVVEEKVESAKETDR